jgi:nucleotidyltransferase substrate binding protein (TIGR01987 family)
MNDENWERKKLSFKNALDLLKESLQLPIDHSIIIDGVIQRFEFTYELAWKWMKQYLEFNGVFEAK